MTVDTDTQLDDPRATDPDRPAPPTTARKPDFFVVGAPKCGTTTLYDYLKTHPQVFMSEPKEPDYFDSDVKFPLIRDERDYLALFAEAGPDVMAGEASALYLYSNEAAARIRDFRPDARIVIMLRQPAEFLFSLHGQLSYDMHCENLKDFKAALDAEPDRRQGRRLPRDLAWEPRLLFYRECATFSTQVRRYLDAFGRDRVHFILFDDFVRDPQGEFSRLCRFLEIRDDVPIESRRSNPGRHWRSKTLAHLFFRMPRPILTLGRLVPRSIRHPARDALLRFNEARGHRKALDPALRRELTIEFTPEIRTLGDLIGRDLSAWCAV
jgi:hypothetical protein